MVLHLLDNLPASLTGDATLVDGAAYLKPGDTVSFTADMGSTGANSFLIGFLGDKYASGGTYLLEVGGHSYEMNLKSQAATTDKVNIYPMLAKTVTNNVANFKTYTGTQTVTITCTSGGGLGFTSILPRLW